jgi:chemotaxis protein CheX
VDILVMAQESSERTERFGQFLAEKGQRAVAAALGGRLPVAEQALLGAVYFDQGEANLLERVQEARERLRYLGAALVVVAMREKPDDQKQLRGAGADLLCDPGTPDALIYKELLSRWQGREVAPEVRRQLAEPLSTAVCQTLGEMAGIEVALQSVHGRAAPAALGDIAVVLELSSARNGLLIMSFSTRTAQALAGQVLAGVHEELTPALVQDCMGEITNVIAGQAKALLHGTPHHFSFSPPVTQIAANLKLPEGMDSLVLAFDSDAGGCALQLCTPR